MIKKVLFQGCPSLTIMDFTTKENCRIREKAIEDMKEKKRLVINDIDGKPLYLIRLVKSDTKTHILDTLTDYLIKVFDSDSNLLFTFNTGSKKWDWWLIQDIRKAVKNTVKYHELISNGKLEVLKEEYNSLVDKYYDKSVEIIRRITDTDLLRVSAIKQWCFTPSADELSDEDLKWYYTSTGGNNGFEQRLQNRFKDSGFELEDYMYNRNCLKLTPNGLRKIEAVKTFNTCITHAEEYMKNAANKVYSVSDWEKVFDSLQTEPWIRLAIERFGGLDKVNKELINPILVSVAEKEIMRLSNDISVYQKQINEWNEAIEHCKQYLSPSDTTVDYTH